MWSYNPEGTMIPSVWAIPRSLAATDGITIVFSSSGYLDVSVPRVYLFRLMGCPIRISLDLCLLAATQSFSQLATSFIASGCLGIHRVPFSTFFLFFARDCLFRFKIVRVIKTKLM